MAGEPPLREPSSYRCYSFYVRPLVPVHYRPVHRVEREVCCVWQVFGKLCDARNQDGVVVDFVVLESRERGGKELYLRKTNVYLLVLVPHACKHSVELDREVR